MIHQPLGGFHGQASDIDIHAREILLVKERLNKILSKHTGQALEQIQNDTDRDNFMSGDDAREYGLIDKVLKQRQPADGEKESSDRSWNAMNFSRIWQVIFLNWA